MDLVRFEHIEYLFALALVIPMVALYWFTVIIRKRRIRKTGDIEIISAQINSKSRFNGFIKIVLTVLAFSFLVLGLANLQFGSKIEKVKREGVDIVIALDLSNSMMAEDVIPNRLDRTKQFINRFIEKLANDRVGLVVFAGQAYIQMPLTIDYSAARLFLSNVNTQIVPTQGTAIGEAIELANQLFEEGTQKYKTLLIFSDGENHEGDAVELAKEAAKKGVIIHTIGVGSPKGGPIPVYRGSQIVDYRKDKDGQIILTKLNEAMLQEISSKAGGKYFRLSGSENILKDLIKTIEGQEKKEIDTRIVTDYNSKFQLFLLAAFLLLLLEFIWPEKRLKVKWFNLNLLNK